MTLGENPEEDTQQPGPGRDVDRHDFHQGTPDAVPSHRDKIWSTNMRAAPRINGHAVPAEPTAVVVCGLRINNVIEPHEHVELFPPFLADPSLRRRNLFADIHARDRAS